MIELLDYQIVCVDFETYYDDLFSLKHIESLEYIASPRFAVHMMGYNTTGRPEDTGILAPEQIAGFLNTLRQSGNPIALLCQNTQFDGLILSHHYNFTADLYLDTRAMAAGLWPHASSGLAQVAIRLWPDDPTMRKGDELALSKGVAQLPRDLFRTLAGYCINDVNLTMAVFNALLPVFPVAELSIIDMLTRWAVSPALELDFELMDRYIPKLDLERRETVANSGLWRFADKYNLDSKQRPQFVKEFSKELAKGAVTLEEREYWLSLKVLNSNKAFAEWFTQQRIPVPLKTTPDNRKIPAFAQNDPEFMAMAQKHPQFEAVWAARGAAKSTQNLTRARKLVKTAIAYNGKVPVPLRYNAAHTGRAGGCLIASTKITTYNTRSACIETKPITEVQADDLVWDGEEFVEHGGVVYSGYREVIEHDGICGTPEHPVFVAGAAVPLLTARERGDSIDVASPLTAHKFHATHPNK